jgi:hypothetical protein
MALSLRFFHLDRGAVRGAALVHDGDRSADDTLGEGLVARVRHGLSTGQAPASGVVVRAAQIDLVPLAPVADARVPFGQVLAGLVGRGELDAIGVVGRLWWRRRRDERPVAVAVVFLEWTDCRWWCWQQLLDAEGRPVADGERCWRAVDGDPKPVGLGGWWSLARRTGARLDLTPAVSELVN